jgi:hypothetical protein
MPSYASHAPLTDRPDACFLTLVSVSICRETDGGLATGAKSQHPVHGPDFAALSPRLLYPMKSCRLPFLALEAWS